MFIDYFTAALREAERSLGVKADLRTSAVCKTGILLDTHKEQNYTWYELVLDPGQEGFKLLM